MWEERWDKAGLEEGEGKCRRGDGTKLNWKKGKGVEEERWDNAKLEEEQGGGGHNFGTQTRKSNNTCFGAY